LLNKLTLEEHNVLQELQSGGIPVNWRPLKTESRISPAIALRQTGNRFDNAVHLRFGYLECCCVLTVAISNRTNRNVRLEAYRLEIPWGVSDFRWLEKPRGNVARGFAYSHAAYCSASNDPPLPIEPERVLNHRFARGFKVFPGETVEGLLIGAGDSELHHYPNEKEIEADLVLFDGRGHDYHLPAVLAVRRKKKPKALGEPQLARFAIRPPRNWIRDEVGQKWLKEEEAERAASGIAKAELEDKCQAETVTV
jgi:hypothetical protein